MGPFRLRIFTEDKVGMTLEILKELYRINVSVDSMDVLPSEVYIKVASMDDDHKCLLKNKIVDIYGVISVEEVNLIPMERNERKLLAIIDSVDEGILAINKNEEIEIFNKYCEDIFNYSKEEIIGAGVDKLVSKDAPVIKLLYGGENYDNREFKLTSKRGESHYLSTGRAIKDDDGNTMGAVVSIRDYDKVKELAQMVYSNEKDAFDSIIGNSMEIQNVKQIIDSIKNSSSTVLLRGESGTGKELFARAIHDRGSRRDKPFIAINCAAIPDSLMESELFGYEPGSFTGGLNKGKDGLFKLADKGTLFLDEIGEMNMSMQAKLLRVLQEGSYRKIGGRYEEKIDARIICATNRNLENMIQNKEFRKDLYYRLNVIPIYIPALKDRKDDIVLLLTYFIEKMNLKLSKQIKGFSKDYLEYLMEYSWPGNIRELENIIERSMNLCMEDTLNVESLSIKSDRDFENTHFNVNVDEESRNLKQLVGEYEKTIIQKAVGESKSIRKAAKVLGVSHATIINKMKRYSVES